MKDNPQVKLYSSSWAEEDSETVDLGRIEFLKGNPFLYNPLNSPYIVSSIEDYRIKYKKDYQAFGYLIRNATYSRYRRRRIAKKTFVFWEKDIKKAQETRVIESTSVIETSGDIKVKRFSGKFKLLLWLMLILLIFIACLTNGLFTKTFGGNFFVQMENLLTNGFIENNWMKVIMNVTLYLIIVTLIYARYYNINIQDFKKITNCAHYMLERNTRILDKEYEKKIKKAKKYYTTSVLKKNYTFAPYAMNLVCEGKIGNQTLDTISQAVIEKSSNFKKKKFWVLLIKNLLMLLSIIGTLLVVVYVIYEVIKKFIF
ncbi:MAG: hypothetical protein RBR48_00265 [Bacilli bacterium]|jgi:hypothetical protein|nr:hypothetical protein [Bacilli bacterium]MDD3348654.1 hypothetical protein [Bacilli bacterium]MDD4056054.1 hypothetical protein [Bacilli bacterium]MDY0208601.1 hypothetical protein [Bacilli bacterium]